jgi:putative endopeptidase
MRHHRRSAAEMQPPAFRSVAAAALAAISFAAPAAPAALDVARIDRSVDPCVDLYEYMNRKWIESTPIPEDRTTWGTFSIVDQKNEALLVAALDEAARTPPAAGSAQRKAIDFYRSGMDTDAIEKEGLKALAPLMARVASVGGAGDLARALGFLHTHGIPAGFAFSVSQDARNSTRYLASLYQGGLGLPDRDYYFKDDERTRQQREAYLKHVARMLQLSGLGAAQAAKDAAAAIALETDLARASMTRVERRDPEKTYHKRSLRELSADAPGLPWAEYFAALGGPGIAEMNVSQPEFFRALARLAEEKPAADWQAYLRWHVLRSTATKLPAAFVDEHFEFNERTMRGRKAQPPRHRHVITEMAGPRGSLPMGQALGRIYVDRAFPPQAKARALEMVGNIRAALGDRLRALDWMSEETRALALEKLSAMQVKIGYPDRWRDYSDADVGPYGFAENWMRAHQYDVRRQLRRLGQPIDRSEWWMSPHIVNAYYSARLNEIVFPAAILQPPFFDAKADDAVNYGAIGMVIGHEITHGFDDSGRKYDARGNLRDWWTPEDARRYQERAQRMVRQYSGFDGVEGLKVNGQLTLGENLSDLGGLRIAYDGLARALRDRPQGPIDGLTAQQRFFLSYAQAWRTNMRAEQERLRLLTGQHSPPRYRVRGPLAHMPEFAHAFSCDASKTLLGEAERADIW